MMAIRIRVQRVLVGHSQPNNFAFSGCSIGISHLHKWTQRSAIERTKTTDGRPAITMNSPTELNYRLNDFVKWSIISAKAGGMMLSDDEHLDFHFAAPVDFEIILRDYISPMRRLFCLLTGEHVRVLTVELHAQHRAKSRSRFSVKLYQRTNNPESAEESSLYWTYLKSLQKDLEGIVRAWFEIQSKLRSVINLFFAVRENPQLNLTQRFLFLAQAAEVYHQYSDHFQPFVFSPATFKARINAIAAAVQPEFQQWVREKLHYANQKTLAEKLSDLVFAHGDALKTLIHDTQGFCSRVKDARNYHTHYDEDLRRKGRVAEGVDLAILADRLEALLILCLADEIGVKDKLTPHLLLIYRNRRWTSSKRTVGTSTKDA
jgi:hypothetical protein